MSVVDRVLVRGDAKTSVVTRRGTQIDLRVVAAAPARRGAPLLHRLEGAQHQAAPARARPRAGRSTSTRSPRSRAARSSRARPRSRSTRRSACPGSRRCCARTAARSRPPRAGALPRPHRRRDRRLPRAHDASRATDARRSRTSVAAAKARGYRVLAITDHAEGTLSGVGREALARAAREDPRDPERARRLAAASARRRAQHRARRRARLRRRVPARLRLVPGVGPRPLRARPRRADPAHRDGDARIPRCG